MLISANNTFNFARAMQQNAGLVISADENEQDYGPLFSDSPLTSPEPTPPPSPQRMTTELPPASLPTHLPQEFSNIDRRMSKRPRLASTMTESQLRRKAIQREKARKLKLKKKTLEKEQAFSHHRLRSNIQANILDKATPIHTLLNLENDARITSTGYGGLNDRGRRGGQGVKLADLVGEDSKHGFTYVSWDGRTPTPVVTADGYVCGVLAGIPDPKAWPEQHRAACDALEDARKCCSPSTAEKNHRRGRFVALRCGLSHGQGSTHPANHHNSSTNTAVLDSLNQKEPFKRLAGFATSVMASWAPDIHEYYSTTLKAIHDHDPSLRRNFPGSVFADTTYNLGPKTVCNRHTDFQNLSFGWCAVTAFGDYDWTVGGHLILWDLHLVIEFPPGSTILIPSAIIAHSNTVIQPNERRYSFTQYTSAGLFRWVNNGFRTADTLSVEEKIEQQMKDAARWEFGLSLTPKTNVVLSTM